MTPLGSLRSFPCLLAASLVVATPATAQVGAAPQKPTPPGGAALPTAPPTTPSTSAAGTGPNDVLAPGNLGSPFDVVLDNGVIEFGAAIKKLANTTPAGVIAETGTDTPGEDTPKGDPDDDGTTVGGSGGDDGGGGPGTAGLPAATGDPAANKTPLLWYRDPGSGGGFYIGGDDFWEFDLVDLETGAHEVVTSTEYDVWGVPTVEQGNGWQEIVIRWRGLTTPRLGLGPFDVELAIRLENGAQTTDMRLRGFPQPQTHVRSGPRQWAFFEGAVCLPIHQDESDPTLEHYLLSPLGLLIEDPSDTITFFDCLARPVSQVFGFYNSDGLGLYGASLDLTGKQLKNFRFVGNNPSDWIQTKIVSYQPDVQLGAVFQALPVRFGIFKGDWWDLAQQYRKFIEATPVAAKGPVQSRNDVPAWAKGNRALGVFASGVPFDLLDGQTLPDHLGDWLSHWGLAPDDALVVQFGPSWVEGDNEGVGPYPVDPGYLPYLSGFESLGVRFGIYIYDVLFNAEAPEYTQEWEDATVRRIDGEPLTLNLDPGGQDLTMAFICPSTQVWLEMVHALAGTMAADHGVDLFYVDNFFPVVQEACFALDHGHPPGLGNYLTEGFAETFREMIAGGNQSGGGPGINFARFSGYSEGHNEAYVPTLGVLGPAQLYTDFVSSDERTRVVPLHAAVYHDLALAGPVRADPYFLLPGEVQCPNPPCDPPAVSVWSQDPADRTLARRSAGYVLGWGWANGSALWSPERSFLDPNSPWAHELVPPLPPELVDGVEATLFAGELGALRGGPVARRFLNLGRRLPDAPLAIRLPLSVTPAPDVEVELTAIPSPYQPGVTLGPERNFVRPVQQGVWSDPSDKSRAYALTNFTQDALIVDLTVNPQELGLDPGLVYDIFRWSGGPLIPVGQISGSAPAQVVTQPIAGESAFLLLLEPQ